MKLKYQNMIQMLHKIYLMLKFNKPQHLRNQVTFLFIKSLNFFHILSDKIWAFNFIKSLIFLTFYQKKKFLFKRSLISLTFCQTKKSISLYKFTDLFDILSDKEWAFPFIKSVLCSTFWKITNLSQNLFYEWICLFCLCNMKRLWKSRTTIWFRRYSYSKYR